MIHISNLEVDNRTLQFRRICTIGPPLFEVDSSQNFCNYNFKIQLQARCTLLIPKKFHKPFARYIVSYQWVSLEKGCHSKDHWHNKSLPPKDRGDVSKFDLLGPLAGQAASSVAKWLGDLLWLDPLCGAKNDDFWVFSGVVRGCPDGTRKAASRTGKAAFWTHPPRNIQGPLIVKFHEIPSNSLNFKC